MTIQHLIARALTTADIGAGQTYELYATPEMKEGFRLYLMENGVCVASHPHTSELAARKDFERRVEAAIMGWDREDSMEQARRG